VQVAIIEQRFHQKRYAANLEHVFGDQTHFSVHGKIRKSLVTHHFLQRGGQKETDEEKKTISAAVNGNVAAVGNAAANTATNIKNIGASAPNPANAQSAATTNAPSDLPDITVNNQVSDQSFIEFVLDINSRLSGDNRLKIKYYKTKGTNTRELIAFTDKNTKLYFDATKSAEEQMDNLNRFLDESIAKDKIDGLKYIYLKTEDRVFYK